MAFQSNGPVMLALPPFRGFTRRIVLIAAAASLAMWVLPWVWPSTLAFPAVHMMLNPWSLAHGMFWQLVTYPFIGTGLLSVLFALLTVWFFGSQLEDERGERWLMEYFSFVTVGGALAATVVSFAAGRWIPGLWPQSVATAGMWPASLAMLLGFGYLHANEDIRFNLIFDLKAKYLVALYLVGYLIVLVVSEYFRFSSVVALSNALCGYLFLRLVPRRGLQFAASEKWFGMRNAMIRNKRKRAAKEFKVYMGKQGKDVHVDDTDDKKWMN
jgi:membrane associated rhomboid family serine protease